MGLINLEYVLIAYNSLMNADKSKEKEPMDWTTRMKIACGAAQALEYLHTAPQPPIVYRDLKASSILLDEEFNSKLSDIGLDKLGLFKTKMPAQSRMMATYGYSAPEYTKGGQLTVKSDVYSFGVIFLELITGRRGLDTTKPNDEQNLVTWVCIYVPSSFDLRYFLCKLTYNWTYIFFAS